MLASDAIADSYAIPAGISCSSEVRSIKLFKLAAVVDTLWKIPYMSSVTLETQKHTNKASRPNVYTAASNNNKLNNLLL